jgi:DNA topoisomerase IB
MQLEGDWLGSLGCGGVSEGELLTGDGVGLAVSERAASSEGARKRAIARVVQEVAGCLGNTPAVARASYIDPRVIDLYQHGRTIASALGELGKDCDFGDLATGGRAEKAVLNLLASA